jgi:hypothetical protein
VALEDLSTGKKKAIVLIALLGIIGLKIIGVFKSKLPVYLILALAGVAIITDPTPTAADTLPGKAVTGQ